MGERHFCCPALSGSSDNGCAFFVPHGRGMSHNRRTPQHAGLIRPVLLGSADARDRTEGLA